MRPEGKSFAIKSQDVKWEGAVLARPAAELARGKGSFRSPPEVDSKSKISFPMGSPRSDGAGVKQSSVGTESKGNLSPQ